MVDGETQIEKCKMQVAKIRVLRRDDGASRLPQLKEPMPRKDGGVSHPELTFFPVTLELTSTAGHPEYRFKDEGTSGVKGLTVTEESKVRKQ